jgi:hypothetical protein
MRAQSYLRKGAKGEATTVTGPINVKVQVHSRIAVHMCGHPDLLLLDKHLRSAPFQNDPSQLECMLAGPVVCILRRTVLLGPLAACSGLHLLYVLAIGL